MMMKDKMKKEKALGQEVYMKKMKAMSKEPDTTTMKDATLKAQKIWSEV